MQNIRYNMTYYMYYFDIFSTYVDGEPERDYNSFYSIISLGDCF